MKRVFMVLTLAGMLIGNLMAGNVSQQTAQRIGQQFLGTTALAQEKAEIQLQLVSAAVSRDGVDFYVFNVNGGGFVIIAGDDRVKPILAYSTTGSYDPEDVADGFAYTLNSFRTEIQYVREHNLAATPDIVEEWRAVSTTGQIRSGRQARAVVGPLCQTIWNQNFPFNSQCPEDPEGNGGYVYAGCVATAMGQVMKYWNYPEQGMGSHTYNPSGYAQQTANFGETEYHFELMPNALDSLSTEEDYFYIAQFLHHCGIAVDMQYSGNGSGAYSFDVPIALQTYFGYSCDDIVTLSFWGFYMYTVEQWIQMLKDGGLDEHMPLYYSGSDDNGAGGHAFVCDGYDENDYFHFNWGWSGRDDAWCPIGALNTTKYAFNDSNAFLGHIRPNNSTYNNRPENITDFDVQENGDMQSVTLTWTNPTLDLNGNSLSAVSVYVYRNREVINEFTDAVPGEAMSLTDTDLAPGLYQYSVIAEDDFGFNRRCYFEILVGEKCELTFELHDDGGDGWKGAAISVTAEDGQRIAIIGMSEGSTQTVTVPLLQGNLNFIWNHGWYHNAEGYDTDFECSFSILDQDGVELFASGELEDGVFLTYLNNCEQGVLTCYPVRNLQGEDQWYNAEEYGAYLTWDKPVTTAFLDHFQVFRRDEAGANELIAEMPYDGSASYAYFDNLSGLLLGEVSYSVNSIYIREDEQCESDLVEVSIGITDVEESLDGAVKLYPNPTEGQLTVEGKGMMHVTVFNMLGQEVLNAMVEGQSSLDLSQCGAGIYMVRIETSNAVTVRKVSVK